MTSSKLRDVYILVQHSAWTSRNHPSFRYAVELRSITLTKAKQKIINKHKVSVYQTYQEASKAEMSYNYPEGYKGMIPQVQGYFKEIKGLSDYVEDIYFPSVN